MILFRTRDLTPLHRAFAEELAATGEPFACVVDERTGPVDTSPWPKVSLTVPACEALGLFCTGDVGWRCGDYGFYLARRQFPDERYFWMIEPDVRFGGGTAGDLFAKFRTETADLIVADLRPADHTYFWEFTLIARGLRVHRCIFPLVRLSARAIDDLLPKRVTLSRSKHRQSEWPNDEVFVATMLANNPGMVCRDLNDFGETLWDPGTLTFWEPLNGEALPMRQDRLTVYHPVLFGAEYRAKVTRVEAPQADRKLWRRVRRRLIREVNRRSRWM